MQYGDRASLAATLEVSGLFDPEFYVAHNSISDLQCLSPAEHFCAIGARLSFDPHPLFNVDFYVKHSPLLSKNPLAHYLSEGYKQLRNPHPLFDVCFYFAQYPELVDAGVEPVRHYIEIGASEGAETHWEFNARRYLEQHSDVKEAKANPLLHYLTFGMKEGRKASRLLSAEAAGAADGAILKPAGAQESVGPPLVKLVAFYLPQFHPMDLNDQWWGKGFTEWSNVVRASPQYEGHYQPHLPSDLGYYDLRLPEIQAEQVALAKRYGLGGFCFYFYWFGGRRLLERPIQQFHVGGHNFPYCLCWANENWTRRWDGLDAEILIAQDHSAQDDLKFIAHVSEYFRGENYIKVDGKPLLIVYRPSLLPNAMETAERWRTWCRDNNVGEIYLAYTQSFELNDPRDYGFDAAIEFPPNNTDPPNITGEITRLNPEFTGTVFDYRIYPKRSSQYKSPDYTLYRSVFPSWDNEARRRGHGISFAHASPGLYSEWLCKAGLDTIGRFKNPDQRLVFINAWNEWAEGAHLEPDLRYGHEWLQATAEALRSMQQLCRPRRLALVTHDCYRHGAQYLLLNIAKMIRCVLGFEVEIVTLGEGPWKERFARLGPLHDLSGEDPQGPVAAALAARLVADGCSGAICNTVVSGLFMQTLSRAGLRTVSLVHELPGIIASYALEGHVQAIAQSADSIVFPASVVRQGFLELAIPPADRIYDLPQGHFRANGAQSFPEQVAARKRLRDHFALAADCQIVLGMAFGDRRKGIDLFVAAGSEILLRRPGTVFIWVGEIEATIEPQIRQAVERAPHPERFLFPGFQDETDDFYAGADVFALSSREDPFPIAVLEALEAGLPVVAFRGSGGAVPLIDGVCGLVAESLSPGAFAEKIELLLRDGGLRRSLGKAGKQRVLADFSPRRYVQDLVKLADPTFLRISVVLPNYNYARYLPERLRTIDEQRAPPYELVILDDASSDNSVDVINELLPKLLTPSKLLVNPTNSGSVFKQWREGVEQTRGDLVWIAEADDLSDPEFLQVAQRPFIDDPAVVLSFTQSKMIDALGEVVGPDYLDYVKDVHLDRWKADYIADGAEEVEIALAIKNTIPNVSGVLFRRGALLEVLRQSHDEISKFKIAGDWVVYAKILKARKIAFSQRALNLHRRHSGSVTLASFNQMQLDEILAAQDSIAEEHQVSPAARSRAAAYVDKLRAQFFVDEGV